MKQTVFCQILFVCLAVTVGCASRSELTMAPQCSPPHLDDGWRVASAQSVGLDVRLLESMTAGIRQGEEFSNVHAVLIVKDGRLVYEEYFAGKDERYDSDGRWRTVEVAFDRDTLHDIRSAGKSVTSALVGIALGSGAIESLDAPLIDFFPEHAAFATPEKRKITLRHALTMSAGLEWNEGDVPYTNPANDEGRMCNSADPVAYVFNRGVTSEPGSTWYYNSGLPGLLGIVVSRATKRPFGAYAREMLFDPLGITDVEWDGPKAWADIPELEWDGNKPWSKVAQPAGSLLMRPRDMAKFGSLYLHDGRWEGRQVLPAGWAKESTRRHIAIKEPESEYGKHGYGYLWWHDSFRTPNGDLEVHAAVGNGQQLIIVIPALDMVVVHLAGRYNEPDGGWMSVRLLLNYIVPAASVRP